MTVVERNFADEKEEKTMTAGTIDGGYARRYAPSLFDRIVMRASLTTLMWARHHAERIAVTHEQRLVQLAAQHDLQRRQNQWSHLMSHPH